MASQLNDYRVDLHVHTCLSPCGEAEMIPPRIVDRSLEVGLDVIGVCDHNSAGNVDSVRTAASGTGLTVVGGIEVTSREEVHLLGLYDDLDGLDKLQKTVHENLPGTNESELYGEQYLVDESGHITGVSERQLIGATKLGVSELSKRIKATGGLAIAAHVERESFGLLGQLGVVPPDFEVDAYGISPGGSVDAGRVSPRVAFSDAHSLDRLGENWTDFSLAEPTVEEIGKGLRSTDGRSFSARA